MLFKLFIPLALGVCCCTAGCSTGNDSKAPAGAAVQPAPEKRSTPAARSGKRNIVFFGNSLTAGYGLDASEAFPALIQSRIDSLRLPYTVVNAGLSGETSAGGLSRLSWILQQPLSVFVLELGGNDGLRGIPVEATVRNLQSIIDQVKKKKPEAGIILAGMQIPPSMGAKYSSSFKMIFKQLADKNNIALIPFLLEGVGGIPDLNQADGIHPTAAGQKIVAENVWKVLKKLLAEAKNP